MKLPTEKNYEHLEKAIEFREKLKTLSFGSPAHVLARERMLQKLIENQEVVLNALIRKAKMGDTIAIKEVLDRLYGKSKETIDFNQNVKFSLKGLAIEREKLQAKLLENVTLSEDEPSVIDMPTVYLENRNKEENG